MPGFTNTERLWLGLKNAAAAVGAPGAASGSRTGYAAAARVRACSSLAMGRRPGRVRDVSVESLQRYSTIRSFFRTLHSSPAQSSPVPGAGSSLYLSMSPYRATVSPPSLSSSLGTSYYLARGKKRHHRPLAMPHPPEFHSTPPKDPPLPPSSTGAEDGDVAAAEGKSNGEVERPPPAPPPASGPEGEGGREEDVARTTTPSQSVEVSKEPEQTSRTYLQDAPPLAAESEKTPLAFAAPPSPSPSPTPGPPSPSESPDPQPLRMSSSVQRVMRPHMMLHASASAASASAAAAVLQRPRPAPLTKPAGSATHVPPALPSPLAEAAGGMPHSAPALPGTQTASVLFAAAQTGSAPPPPPSPPSTPPEAAPSSAQSPPPSPPPTPPINPATPSSPPSQPSQSPPPPPPPTPAPGDPAYLRSYPRYLRRLARSLPHIHLRPPSIDDILKVTTGFWQRLSVRFRWLTIRSFRRFTAEEYGTFLGWFVLSQTVWLLVGTTTFVGAVVWTLNSLQLQHYVARVICDYLMSETGWDIAYESATVPRWRDATLTFRNVYVSQKPTTVTTTKEDGTTEERASYMTVNVDIDSIDVTLSLWRWLDGKGLVKNAVVKGVRGIIDRRNVFWDPDKIYDPAEYRHPTQPGSFELDSLRIEDALVTVYQTRRFRPFFVSIYKAEINTFRRQWMFYDFISAESIVGQFDNCLFSVHRPQSVSRTREHETKGEGWKRMSRLRIDGVNIDHIKATLSSDTGPLSWIQSGKVDAVLDIRFPTHPDDDNLDLGQIISNITAELTESMDRIPGQRELARPALEVPEDMEEARVEAIEEELQGAKKPRKVEIDIDLRFRDLKAAVPMWTGELSYYNNALIRPIVAFINANRTLLPIRARIVKDLSDFDGSWTLWETGLMDDIAGKTYDALAYHVTHSMNRNIKAVSLWSLQMTANAVLAALRNAFDHTGEGLLNLRNLQGFAM